MTIEKLLELINDYNPEEVDNIKKAYDYAERLHAGQFRQSGEPYIIHPLNVAYILAELHADRDTVCAGLLHDVIEDTEATKEDIAELFGKNVANLVDGVTKLAKMNFSSKEEENAANTGKIITGITEDIRIIIIKLADRLHNMRTLEYKSPFKQKENALETLEIFVPIAYYIGAYRIKSELEDLSLRYLKPEIYQQIKEKRDKIEKNNKDSLNEMKNIIQAKLKEYGIDYSEIKVRTKNIYGIYKKLNEGNRLSDIHDLLSLKICVEKRSDCYQALGVVHELYKPINNRFKDYISEPKTNKYSSIHTTVFGYDGRLVQVQIRTFEMDKVASFGLTTHWDINKGEARNTMKEDLKDKYQFYRSLAEIVAMYSDNGKLVSQVKKELFSDNVYINYSNGDTTQIQMLKGSKIIDLAYQISPDIGNTLVGAYVNGEYAPVDYTLQNKDRIKIITDELSFGPREDWLDIAKTSYAKKKIREFNGK